MTILALALAGHFTSMFHQQWSKESRDVPSGAGLMQCVNAAASAVLIAGSAEASMQRMQGCFERNGIAVRRACESTAALSVIRVSAPDVVIVSDAAGTDAMEMCRVIRAEFDGTIWFLASDYCDVDHIIGLELGADDYLAVPHDPRVMLARLRAHVRMRRRLATTSGALVYGMLRIDPAMRTVVLAKRVVALTDAEFDLLELLARHAGKVLSRDQILAQLRGIAFDGLDRSIDSRISRLRRALSDDGRGHHGIKTVRGKGYLFSPAPWT